MGTSGTHGSPRRGQADAMDMAYEPGSSPRGQTDAMDMAYETGSSPHGPGGPPSRSLGAMIGQWKSRLTKRAWKLPGMQRSPIWQRNYYEHIIRDEASMRRIEEYIQNNPQRWAQDQLHPQASPNPFNQDRSHGD
jgi:hypothetical protein